jgi:hypothetical protein
MHPFPVEDLSLKRVVLVGVHEKIDHLLQLEHGLIGAADLEDLGQVGAESMSCIESPIGCRGSHDMPCFT